MTAEVLHFGTTAVRDRRYRSLSIRGQGLCRLHDVTGLRKHSIFLIRMIGNEHVLPGKADRKSTRLNSSHLVISYAVFCFNNIYHHLAGTHRSAPLVAPPRCPTSLARP